MSSWGNVSLAIIHCRHNGDLNTGIGNGDEMELELGETTNKTTIFFQINEKWERPTTEVWKLVQNYFNY